MAEERKTNLCQIQDIGNYVKQHFSKDIETVEKLIKETSNENCNSMILQNIIKNTLKIPEIKLTGIISYTTLYSKKYDKYIVLLGDVHIDYFHIHNTDSIYIQKYLETYFNHNTKLIDFYIERPLGQQKANLILSPLSQTYNHFEDCYNKKNCSFRFHSTDIRHINDEIENIHETIFQVMFRHRPLNSIFQTPTDVERFKNSFMKLFLNPIQIISKINKQVDNVIEQDIKNQIKNFQSEFLNDRNKKEFEDFFEKLKDFTKDCIEIRNEALEIQGLLLDQIEEEKDSLESKEKIDKINKNIVECKSKVTTDIQKISLKFYNNHNETINKLLHMDVILVDFYTIARMFRKFDSNNKVQYNPEPKYIIVFQGQQHINNIKKFLKEKLNFTTDYEHYDENRNINLKYNGLPHYFFNDGYFNLHEDTKTFKPLEKLEKLTLKRQVNQRPIKDYNMENERKDDGMGYGSMENERKDDGMGYGSMENERKDDGMGYGSMENGYQSPKYEDDN